MKFLKNLGVNSILLLLAFQAVSTVAQGKPNRNVVPIVDEQAGYLLGGSRNGQWLTAEKIAPFLKGGETYRSYKWNARLGSGRGSKPKSFEAPCPETLELAIKPKGGSFAVGSPQNALLRRPQLLNVNSTVYQQEISKLLKSHGIANPVVKIKAVWRVDLEGDGSQEVLIEATNHLGYPQSPGIISPNARAGEYSLVLVRKLVKGQVKTIVLDEEYHLKTKESSAPNIFKLAGVLDVNGDGKMEVLVRSSYYEGDSTTVYEFRGDRAVPVLSEGCGA